MGSTGQSPANTFAIKDPAPKKAQSCSVTVNSTDPRRLLPRPQVFVCTALYQRSVFTSAARSSAPWKSSRAPARDSSCSRGRDLMRAVVASLSGPQRRVRRRRVQPASPSWRPSWRPSSSQSCTARVWRISSRGMPAITMI